MASVSHLVLNPHIHIGERWLIVSCADKQSHSWLDAAFVWLLVLVRRPKESNSCIGFEKEETTTS